MFWVCFCVCVCLLACVALFIQCAMRMRHIILSSFCLFCSTTFFLNILLTSRFWGQSYWTCNMSFSLQLCLIHFTIVWECVVKDSFGIKSTDALNSNFIGITTLHVSDSLSAHHQEFLAVYRLWYILCSCDEPFATRSGMERSSILLLVANGHHNCIKCTKADVQLRTPDDGQKGCPKHVE